MAAWYCATRASASCQLPPALSCFMESTELATITLRGPTLTVRGLSTPSSSAIHIPAMASSAFMRSMRRNSLSSRASGSASNMGPIAYTLSGITAQRGTITGISW